MSECDFSNVTNTSGMLSGCSSLVDFKAPKNIKCDFSIAASTKLSYESLVDIINNLGTVNKFTALTLSEVSQNKLSESEVQIITDKGWYISKY